MNDNTDQFDSPPSAPMIYAPTQLQTMLPKKPTFLTVVAVITLVSGILNLFVGLMFIFTCYLAVLTPYLAVVGILEIIYAAKILPDPVREYRPQKYIAIMEIIAVISCNWVTLASGIVALIAYNQPDVQQYFAQIQRGVTPPAPPPGATPPTQPPSPGDPWQT